MSESNVPPAGPDDPYDTAPASAPPPPPDAAMLNPNPTPPPPAGYPGQPIGYAGPMTSGYPASYNGPPPDPNAKTMGMLCHLLSLSGLVVPFGNLIGPLIIWQVKKAEHPFIDDQGKEAVNFQILVTIALIVSALLMCVVVGFFLLPIFGLLGLIMAVIAGIKANGGEAYRYPFNIRFIK